MKGEIDIISPIVDVFVPTKTWYAFVDDNNVIVRTIGSMFPVTNLKCTDAPDMKILDLGNINEKAWVVINKIVHSPYYSGYISEKTKEIIYYRLKSSVSNSDKKDGIYHITSNKCDITVSCLDEHGDDVIIPGDDLQVKKLRSTRPPGLHSRCIFDKHASGVREISLNQPRFTANFEELGEYTLRLTYKHPVGSGFMFFERYLNIMRVL